ncbi:urotensin 2 domain containing [Eucyclogobius newberryi]|uniref:urotensin 2 domain containing n=1 Tax=Eucyclogobius newberryi TaxID=166745 RepID=UPI003B5A02CE
MDAAVNYCVGLLCLLLLQGALHVEARSILNTESGYFNTNEDIESQNKILALLLHKSIISAEKEDPLAAILAHKLAELEEQHSLKNGLEDREFMIKMAQKRLLAKKRAEPCFWKYCV